MPTTRSVVEAKRPSPAAASRPMGDLSPHFSQWEFRDHRTGTVLGPSPELVQLLERIRALDGRPLRVVSGYRTTATNAAVGGASNSQHLYGRAADIEPGRIKAAQALALGARGVGFNRDGWVVHVDVRPSAPVTFADY